MTRANQGRDLFGLTRKERRIAEAWLAKRDAAAALETMRLAAKWAIEHGEPVRFDSKGWPVDANDWPLPPPAGSTLETTRRHRKAVSMAKGRRTRRAKPALLAFDITKLDLRA